MEYLHKENDIPTYLFIKRMSPNPHVDVFPVIVSTISGFAINEKPSHTFGYRITDTYFTDDIFTGLCEAWLENQHDDMD